MPSPPQTQTFAHICPSIPSSLPHWLPLKTSREQVSCGKLAHPADLRCVAACCPAGVLPGEWGGLWAAAGPGGGSPAGVCTLCGCGECPAARPRGLPLPSVPGGQDQAESPGRRLSGVATAGGPVQVCHCYPPFSPPPPHPLSCTQNIQPHVGRPDVNSYQVQLHLVVPSAPASDVQHVAPCKDKLFCPTTFSGCVFCMHASCRERKRCRAFVRELLLFFTSLESLVFMASPIGPNLALHTSVRRFAGFRI